MKNHSTSRRKPSGGLSLTAPQVIAALLAFFLAASCSPPPPKTRVVATAEGVIYIVGFPKGDVLHEIKVPGGDDPPPLAKDIKPLPEPHSFAVATNRGLLVINAEDGSVERTLTSLNIDEVEVSEDGNRFYLLVHPTLYHDEITEDPHYLQEVDATTGDLLRRWNLDGNTKDILLLPSSSVVVATRLAGRSLCIVDLSRESDVKRLKLPPNSNAKTLNNFSQVQHVVASADEHFLYLIEQGRSEDHALWRLNWKSGSARQLPLLAREDPYVGMIRDGDSLLLNGGLELFRIHPGDPTRNQTASLRLPHRALGHRVQSTRVAERLIYMGGISATGSRGVISQVGGPNFEVVGRTPMPQRITEILVLHN